MSDDINILDIEGEEFARPSQAKLFKKHENLFKDLGDTVSFELPEPKKPYVPEFNKLAKAMFFK